MIHLSFIIYHLSLLGQILQFLQNIMLLAIFIMCFGNLGNHKQDKY